MRTITWLTALTLLAASVSACDPNEGPTPTHQPQVPAGPMNDAGDPIVKFSTNVPNRCAPYTVRVLLQGGRGNNPDRTWHVAGSTWGTVLSYSSGKHIQATLSILDAKMGCVLRADEIRVMGCKITDGSEILFKPLNSSGTAVCVATLKR